MKILFKEEQNYPGAWVWLVLSGLTLGSFSLMLSKFDEWDYVQEKFGYNELIIACAILCITFIGLFFLFKIMRLELTIDNVGIKFRYPPFKNKVNSILKSEIKKYEVKKYKPVKEYGGWGYRQGIGSKKKIAYNVKGSIGLELKLQDGRSILFGTQRREAIQSAMNKLMEGKFNG